MMIDGRRSNLFIYAREQVANLVNSRKREERKKRENVEFTHGREKV